jgi:hypothetical protein
VALRLLLYVSKSVRFRASHARPVSQHHHDRCFEFPPARTFQKVIDRLLNPLTDLFLATFLAYRAGDILDFNSVGCVYRSAWVSLESHCEHFPGIDFEITSIWISTPRCFQQPFQKELCETFRLDQNRSLCVPPQENLSGLWACFESHQTLQPSSSDGCKSWPMP